MHRIATPVKPGQLLCWSSFLVSLFCACLLGACSAEKPADTREAGRVFDRVFIEQEVIDYIDDYRAGSATTSDDAWVAWMQEKGTDAEALRKEVLTYLAENWLVERAASLRNITIDDAEVAQALAEQQSQYPSKMAWTRALINSGYTEDAYALSVKSSLLKEKIKDSFAEPEKVTDDELLDYASNRLYGTVVKRTSAIYISSEDGAMAAKARAQQAREELLGGADFPSVFEAYSSSEYSEDGDMGYNYYHSPTLQYNKAVNALSHEGDISDVVEAADGYFVIVLTEILQWEDFGSRLKLSKVPDELLDEFRVELARQKSNESYNDFYTSNVSDAQVAIEPIPDGLPYDIAVPKASEDSEGEDGEEADSNNNAEGLYDSEDTSGEDEGELDEDERS